MHKKLIYNGTSSADMGLVIQAPPAYSVPERDVEKTHVPGRNGDVISDNGCYKNTTREFSLAKGYVYGPVKTTIANGQELYEWLTSAKGRYVRLEDDYDPSVYRMATYISSGTLTDIFDKALTFSAKFECKPQRYLKMGEQPIEYMYGQTEVYVNNLYHYESKPEIKIENIPFGMSAVTLMSISDETGEETSLVTLKGGINSSTTLIVNSETEECYDDEGNNASDKISLNGKNFPILKKGNNKILISQYDREEFEIPSYNTILQSKQSVCESKFSPKDTTIDSLEEKYIIRQFDALIKERENSFDAESYSTRLTDLCDAGVKKNGVDYAYSGTLPDPNDYYNGITLECEATDFSTFSEKFSQYGLDFLVLEVSGGSYKIRVAADHKCYARTPSNKNLRLYNSNEYILDMNGKTDGVEIEVCSDIEKALDNDTPTFIKSIVVVDSNRFISAIGYKFDISYDKYGSNSICIYYKNKVGLTGLFGKAGWSLCHDNDIIINYVWSSWKNKLTQSGLSISSSSGYSLRFIAFNETSKQYLQYDFGVNSSKIFNVELNSIGTGIQLFAAQEGYYSVDDNNWKHAQTGSTTQIDEIEFSKSFKVRYLKEVPKYSNERDWPSWLNSDIEFYDNDNSKVTEYSDILNSSYMKVKSNLATYYRYYDVINDTETVGSFYELAANNYIRDSEGNELKIYRNESAKIGKYWSTDWPNPYEVPSFDYDRGNSIDNSIISSDLPEWLTYKVEMKIKFNSDPEHEYVAEDGVSYMSQGIYIWTIQSSSSTPPLIIFSQNLRGMLN